MQKKQDMLGQATSMPLKDQLTALLQKMFNFCKNVSIDARTQTPGMLFLI